MLLVWEVESSAQDTVQRPIGPPILSMLGDKKEEYIAQLVHHTFTDQLHPGRPMVSQNMPLKREKHKQVARQITLFWSLLFFFCNGDIPAYEDAHSLIIK